MATASEWRARRVIESTLAALPAGADSDAKRRALRAAYPFGPREHHPYRCWLRETRVALGGVPVARPARVDWEVLPAPTFHVRVACGWCESAVGCLACGRMREVLAGLDENSDLRGLMAAVRANPDSPLPRLVLADWLAERGFDRLEELFRATCEG